MNSFEIKGDQFLLDGEPFRILAGAMHYFRIHPDCWRDRMKKMKLMGLNTLETYVAWNVHEPKPGEFNFDGFADLVSYVKLADELGLKVIVRPGPYICSEWEFGGLPAWLLKDPGMRIRCNHKPYIDAVARFFKALLPPLESLQIQHGGPIIMMQIENEYGSYGNDKDYLRALEEMIRDNGITVPLFTSDGPNDQMLGFGTLPHILKTVNFGSNAQNQFAKLREYQPEGPLMCMEFWNGWFDHWGEDHHTRKPEDAAQALEEILEQDASVCFYMFHGGTNFGFMNGANCGEKYQPTIGSYDDDAPVNEQGNITPKYQAFQDVLRRYTDVPDAPLPEVAPTMSIPSLELKESAGLLTSLDVLSTPIPSATPEPMERFDQNYGFIVYETHIPGPCAGPLRIRELHDRGHVFVDGKQIAILEREHPVEPITLTVPGEGLKLTILVENMGRANYGNHLADRKGITDCVMLGQQILYGWTIYPLPLTDLSAIPFTSAETAATPGFFRGQFTVDTPEDTFLLPKGFTKGVAWINGFNLGRYWKRGPQQTLYIPKPLLKLGDNELVLFELDDARSATVEFLANPILDEKYEN